MRLASATRTAQGPRLRAPKLPADARRQQVLDVAIRVFAERGYAGASTLLIAAEAGVGEPTIYRHFASKRTLFLAAFDRSSTEVLERWRAIAAECSSPVEAIQRIGIWYTEQLRDRPQDLLFRYRSLAHNEDPELSSRVRSNYLETLAFVQDLYERARERGELAASADPRALAWLFMAIGAALDQAQILGLGDELSSDAISRLARLVQSGVEKPSP